MQAAFIFPGQGSQTVGMLQDLAEQYPVILSVFNQVSDKLGYDVWHLVQTGPIETLNQTQYTQVAMLTADVAVCRALQASHSNSALPKWMAGHSLGEYAALVCAGAIDLTSAAWLVSERGRLMQLHVPLGVGAMAAIVGLTDEQVVSICVEASNVSEIVEPANYNAIGQVVIAGHMAAVERAIALAESQQARLAKQIPVSVPCHCSLLKTASEEFRHALEQVKWNVPETAVINNVAVEVYRNAEQIKSTLVEQLYSPVRWVETIQKMKSEGVTSVIECGPGKVLSGLVKRIDKSIEVINDPFTR